MYKKVVIGYWSSCVPERWLVGLKGKLEHLENYFPVRGTNKE